MSTPNFWFDLDGQPISVEEAGALLADRTARRVAYTNLVTERGTVEVSTVFLVFDHNHSGIGRPVLWETMAFGGPTDQEQWRYRSREEAVEGHAAAVAWVRTALDVEGVAVLADETVGAAPPVVGR